MMGIELDGHAFEAERLVEGILVDPSLPGSMDIKAESEVARWSMRPFIRTERYSRPKEEMLHEELSAAWERAWPSGVKYGVWYLDPVDRNLSNALGCYPTLEEALKRIRLSREMGI